jgi:hypothetical protein
MANMALLRPNKLQQPLSEMHGLAYYHAVNRNLDDQPVAYPRCY